MRYAGEATEDDEREAERRDGTGCIWPSSVKRAAIENIEKRRIRLNDVRAALASPIRSIFLFLSPSLSTLFVSPVLRLRPFSPAFRRAFLFSPRVRLDVVSFVFPRPVERPIDNWRCVL